MPPSESEGTELERKYKERNERMGLFYKEHQIEIADQYKFAWTASVADFRERFKQAPIGQWSTHIEYIPCPSGEKWEFCADHMGKIQHLDYGMGLTFEWKEVGIRTINCRLTGQFIEDWGAYDEDIEDEDEEIEREVEEAFPKDWITIHYDFKVIEYYGGYHVVLYESGPRQPDSQGFWLCSEPLMFDGEGD